MGPTSRARLKLLSGIASVLLWILIAGNTPVRAQSSSSGYTFQRAITTDHTKVPNSDQSNFAVLISGTYPFLATTANGGNVSSPNGYDILFTSDAAGTAPLSFEQESYNAATGAMTYWVKVPTLSHTTDTVIYLFYGNPGIGSFQGGAAGTAWDSTFLGVWHMSDNAGNTTVTDSTAANNAVAQQNTSALTANGEISAALTFNGSTDYLAVPQNGRFNLHAQAFSLEAWIQDDTTAAGIGGYFHRALSWNDGSNAIELGLADGGADDSSRVFYGTNVAASGNAPSIASTGNAPAGYNHVVFTFDGASAYHIYVNGVQSDGGTVGTNNTVNVLTRTSSTLYLGQRGDNRRYLSGALDEARISNVARTADWIAAEYNNQSNPQSFYGIGQQMTPQTAPAIAIPPAITTIPPTITTRPISQTVAAGQTATFSVAATGTAPLSYQWIKNGAAISGAISSTYTTPSETASDNGAQFSVAVSNSAGSVSSSPAVLTVNSAPGTLNASSSNLNFGNVHVGASTSQSVTLTNSSNTIVIVLSVSLAGAGFNPSGLISGLILQPHQTATLNVAFAPAGTGAVTGSVIIVSTAANPTLTINLLGTGTQSASSSILLSWTASASSVSGYDIFRSTVSGGPYSQLNSSLVTSTQFVDNTVQAGQIYYYVVTAVDSSNVQSPYSNQATMTIP